MTTLNSPLKKKNKKQDKNVPQFLLVLSPECNIYIYLLPTSMMAHVTQLCEAQKL